MQHFDASLGAFQGFSDASKALERPECWQTVSSKTKA